MLLFTSCLHSFSVPSILRNNRFRRDARSMEEEEEMYFEAEEDLDDDDTMLPMSEMLKPKFADNEFDQIKNKMLESRKGMNNELFCL